MRAGCEKLELVAREPVSAKRPEQEHDAEGTMNEDAHEPGANWTQVRAQISDCLDKRLQADDVVHQPFGDRLLHGSHSELALGVLGMKDHRTAANAYDFRGIQRALSPSCPLQTGSLALSQAWARR